jgi:hypothetical protein
MHAMRILDRLLPLASERREDGTLHGLGFLGIRGSFDSIFSKATDSVVPEIGR